ncbi:hypothetical protein UKMH10_1860 [Burkholderia pseudomallei]|nr:MFS transporter [Burkholderia pseudomallei]VUD49125.1 hypothetical protein UKMH10_1860 [Burkholderia pseudomallei]
MRAGDFRVTAAVVASALFMQNLDSTVVATALPSMARELGVNVVFLSSAITSYLVALTVFIPVSGWIAEHFGAKRVFIAAIAIFTAASVMCAAANGLATLVAARILQGAGGALMVPVGRLILYRGVSRHEMLAATTWLTMPALVGPLLGPPLGGFLTDALSWRAVFWINVPVGVAGAALAARLVPASAGERRAPADARGMLLVGAALAALMLGVETAGRDVLPAGRPPCASARASRSAGSRSAIAGASRIRSSICRCSAFRPFTRRRSRAACSARGPARCRFSCRSRCRSASARARREAAPSRSRARSARS